ncbi:hypothetical protein WH47_02275 [Habropoda laboriosa]|uniref:Uncharacterized protein n=1 Tax=Habropoda laboriosa TaxID=597456 RepID=A0A0L7QYU7_9HYME|nr:hypothetical protein WH47_02275 [Habropoda laboriosa]
MICNNVVYTQAALVSTFQIQDSILRLGYWGNMATMAVATGYVAFDTYNEEDTGQVMVKMRNGGLDRSMRARYLRKSFEHWKRAVRQSNRIAFPRVDVLAGRYWADLIAKAGAGTGTTTRWCIESFLTLLEGYSWDVNWRVGLNGSTLMGLRTPSLWWRSIINTEWSDFCLGGTGLPANDQYSYDDTAERWTFSSWSQFGQGEDDPP